MLKSEILEEKLNKFMSMSRNNQKPVQTKKEFQYPSLSLLKDYEAHSIEDVIDSSILETKLYEFGFKGYVVGIRKGPMVTRYEVKLAPGVRLSQVRNVSEDLAIALESDRVRILAPIPGTSLIGFEVVNKEPATIGLKSIMEETCKSKNDFDLPIAVGTDTMGDAAVLDLAKMPHMLIAGQTGSGKSVGLNALILSLLYTKSPEECQLILVDPKRVEMASYEGLPHLRQPVIVESDEATEVFCNLVDEMERRYELLCKHKVRNIGSYNSLEGIKKMPYIVTVVDEMSDLMMASGKALEEYIVRLAQKSRAIGIHLVLATQKPVVKVITGLIKSNMPSRISFQVASKTDSRVILDVNGAEKLAGRGDMLATYPGVSEPKRLHGAWVSDQEISAVTNFLKGVE